LLDSLLQEIRDDGGHKCGCIVFFSSRGESG